MFTPETTDMLKPAINRKCYKKCQKKLWVTLKCSTIFFQMGAKTYAVMEFYIHNNASSIQIMRDWSLDHALI